MGGRYAITGAEIALLVACSEEQRKEILKNIEDTRFLFESNLHIDDDVKKIRMVFGEIYG